MKRIIFFCPLPYIWDNGKYMINHKDYRALVALGRTLNIDAIIHSPRTCDYISALALRQGCKSKATVQDEYLMDTSFLKPSHFFRGTSSDNEQQRTRIHCHHSRSGNTGNLGLPFIRTWRVLYPI